MRGVDVMPPNPITHWLSRCRAYGASWRRDTFFPALVWTWSRRYLAEFIRRIDELRRLDLRSR